MKHEKDIPEGLLENEREWRREMWKMLTALQNRMHVIDIKVAKNSVIAGFVSGGLASLIAWFLRGFFAG